MLYALQNQEKVLATPKSKATCPQCLSDVKAKCGRINTWHWAHVSNKDCDSWSDGETEWHLNWKSKFEKERVEVLKKEVIEYYDPIKGHGFQTTTHRADAVMKDGTVVEFQHSSISLEDMGKREEFYREMIWIFDVREPYEKNRLRLVDRTEYFSYFWDWVRKHIFKASKPIFLDFDDKSDSVFLVKKAYNNGKAGWGKFVKKSKLIDG